MYLGIIKKIYKTKNKIIQGKITGSVFSDKKHFKKKVTSSRKQIIYIYMYVCMYIYI